MVGIFTILSVNHTLSGSDRSLEGLPSACATLAGWIVIRQRLIQIETTVTDRDTDGP
jgi:hypothetical protein